MRDFDGMYYKGSNGYVGIQCYDSGFQSDYAILPEHYDICIYKDNKLYMHFSREDPYTFEEFKDYIENDFENEFNMFINFNRRIEDE